MGNMNKKNKSVEKSSKDLDRILNERFSYLPEKERYNLLYGNEFMEVPTEELKRLRIDAYPYLM